MTSHATTRHVIVAAASATCLALTAIPAAAHHEHHVATPGTCVTDVAKGQTAKGDDDPGGHVFHTRVHMRTHSNGTRIGDLTDGRVRVLKDAELDDHGLAEACSD